jgi:hypothetical protein
MDLEKYQELVDRANNAKVNKTMLQLKALVNLLFVPWKFIE